MFFVRKAVSSVSKREACWHAAPCSKFESGCRSCIIPHRSHSMLPSCSRRTAHNTDLLHKGVYNLNAAGQCQWALCRQKARLTRS